MSGYNVLVSVDVRSPDWNNPYSFDFRKKMIQDEFSNVEVIPHYTYDCETTADYLNTIVSSLYEHHFIEGVIGGPSLSDEVVRFWEERGIPVRKIPKRFFNISGTEVRNRNISIITDFGCDNNCWYCVWKSHSLSGNKFNTDWDRLQNFLNEHSYKDKVSVSGGGDPLYRYEKEFDIVKWWNKLFSITNKKIDVHTRRKLYNIYFWSKINRVSFSIDDLEHCEYFLKYVSQYTKVRMVHVVTRRTREEDVQTMKDFAFKNGFQLTLKRLSGWGDGGKFDYFKIKFPELFFLEEGDYNLYFMPDNTVKTVYQY